jgi:hypothetical protein
VALQTRAARNERTPHVLGEGVWLPSGGRRSNRREEPLLKKLIAALVGLAAFAPAALASSHFIKVSPGKVQQGKTVRVSGSVDHGCEIGHKGDAATIISKAFKGATKKSFAGVPAVSASLAHSTNGTFSIKVKLSTTVNPGKYSVSGRCGGGNFGSTTLKVTAPPLPGQY